ncbi:C40 family peptidase [Pseudonocardia eucalypti]|uniref:C40 family peptidase n=1 Tax=Pseudonocardia eucalypti TaxID=648755 RepID=A0ABP9QUM4_9PSEU|nr:cell wall-associated NlpC family hydrolase [Pseudonocardia eucalypti]
MAPSGNLRSFVGALSATALALAASALFASPAAADPAPAPPKPDARAQLADAQHDAEQLTEQWHEAKDNLDAKRDEATRAKAAVVPARQAASRAEAAEEKFRGQLDQVVARAAEGGRLDELNALVLSDSPSDFLDQMTTLEMYSADQKSVLDQAQRLVADARKARANADQAVAVAAKATDEARQAVEDIGKRKKEADARIAQAERLLGRLSPSERADRTKSIGDPVGVVLGGGKGALALKAAMSRIGGPYVWGAEGQRSFDCSGLVFWAFQKVGITMPRSSSAQAQVGRPVSRSQLQPGDLVFFYHPVSHVGFYAGDGKVLNAVQTGDTVRYTELSKMKSYAGARRL